MKKLLIAFFGLFLLINYSCSRDEGSNANFTSNSVVGKWYMSSTVLNGTAKITSTGQSTPINNQTVSATACVAQSYDQYNTDGTNNSVVYSDQTGSCAKISESSTHYTYDSNTHVLTDKDNNLSITLSKLTNTEMSYQYTLNNQDMGNGVTFTGTVTLNLVKK